MSNFRVNVDLSSLELGAGGLLTGQIWIEVCGKSFPEVSWNDFVPTVLTWWCEAVSNLPIGIGNEGVLRFMDGPYSVSISTQADGHILLAARTSDGCVPTACVCTNEEIRGQVLASARAVLKYCDKHGLESNDVRALRIGVDQLR